ncbi:MAG: adenosylcobinamide-GDP ribazoletransferase [Desulfomonile tiedjei]|nr:adenosylcobinamide-GDP ribazoletransferase [Desulfomonile tiedjei]
MLRAFEIALAFLTIFKTRTAPVPDMAEVGKSAWAFPLAGAVIGILLVAAHVIAAGHLPSVIAAILIVALWVVLTGGLHLDGWTDCWDALAASVSPERRFEILKDSRLGAFSALALVLLLALKAAALAQSDLPLLMLFLSPVISRSMMVAVGYGSRHRGQGMAALFLSGLDIRSVRWTCVIGFAPALLAGWKGIIAVAAAYFAALWFRGFAEKRLGSVNGDVLGAICELSEVVVLLVACLRW